MSGVEVAGIVLGSIPLIIAALEHYRQGKGHASSFRKYGPHLNILISRLQKQKTLFYLYTVILMRDAGVPYFTTSADPEYEDCAKILLEPQTQVSLKQYLGITYSAFEAVIKDFEQSLKSIVEGLGRIRRDPQVNDHVLSKLTVTHDGKGSEE